MRKEANGIRQKNIHRRNNKQRTLGRHFPTQYHTKDIEVISQVPTERR